MQRLFARLSDAVQFLLPYLPDIVLAFHIKNYMRGIIHYLQ